MSEYTREEILKLIEENGGPEGLDLSKKDLTDIDLSDAAIAQELKRVQNEEPSKAPVWFSESTRGINLAKAILQWAELWSANLQGADLEYVNLQEARLYSVNLKYGNLHGADLQQADLRNANLYNACLRFARLERTHLEYVNLQRANLFGANLQSANLKGANLQETRLTLADFQGADLWHVDLQRADLTDAKLKEANLRGASLQGASPERANLRGAHLEYSHLEKVDLFSATSLEGAYFYNAFLDATRLTKEQLGEAIGEELEGKYDEAKEAYLALKNNFAEIGRYDDAAWAYRKERRMEKLAALQKAKDAWQKHDWKGAIPRYAKAAVDQLVEWACDYGESVPRVLCSLLAIYVLFMLIYGLTWSVIRVHATPTAIIREPTRNLVDLARFSLGAMTTMDLAGLEPRNGLVELVAGLEALLGIALTGLLGFVGGNRIRRS